MKKILAYLLIIILFFGAIFIYAQKDKQQMESYAKVKNCTWYATGTMYGDDRDFICK